MGSTADRRKRKPAHRSSNSQSGRTLHVATRPLMVRSWSIKLLLVALSLACQVLIFPPTNWWPLAYVCFVPWLVMIGAAERPRRVYLTSYILGISFFAISMRWLYIVTIPGAVVLFLSMALYFPLVACPIRHIIRRRRWPLAVLFPPIWVGCEALRSMVIPRFPWNLLGHSQYTVLSIIQVSDLGGAYAVSFVVAAVNGLVADVVFAWLGHPGPQPQSGRRFSRVSIGFAAAILVFAIGYGVYQRTRDTTREGPKVAIIQGNYPNYVDPARIRARPTMEQRVERYIELLHQAGKERPDMFVLPETAWPMFLNREALDRSNVSWSQWCYDLFDKTARSYNAYVVTGSMSLEPTPLDVLAKERRYNSAFVFGPVGGPPGRYDKIHLVLIGEYAPFRYGPLRFVYLWLNQMYPLVSEEQEYSLTAGTEFTTFTMSARTQDGKSYRFATPICYENVMPYISRRFVNGQDGRKRCDFLLNLSNDGWFAHSTEQRQHLAASVFRAVENRVGIARAVNTGISCFIDPDGRIHHVVEEDGRMVGPGVDGYRVARLKTDDRHTVYSRYADILAIICACLWGVFYVDYVRARMAEQRRSTQPDL